ncbi:MAG: glycoside hydrolase family 95 protein [Cellulosilyticaceae bacterium]
MQKLWYKQPAKFFTEALPIGNGSLGGMVYGGVKYEKISLNEDTIWSGYPEDKTNDRALESIQKARVLLEKGEIGEAETELWKNALSTWTTGYQPAGDLCLTMNHEEEYSGFCRELNIEQGIAKTTYSIEGVTYTREIFCSYPDKVMTIKMATSQPNWLNFQMELLTPHKYKIEGTADSLYLEGGAPIYAAPPYYECDQAVIYDELSENRGITFGIGAKIDLRGGISYYKDNVLKIEDADEVTIYLTIQTNFEGYDKQPINSQINIREKVITRLSKLRDKDYDEIISRHIQDYSNLYDRVELHIEGIDLEGIPTDKRLERYTKDTSDVGLGVLLFNYGRYLTIAASREGSQAMNLQGIWNEKIRAPWSSNYTLNINTQMNYWHVEACQLSECHMPLINLIDELAQKGYHTAKTHYNSRGWCAHHNTDLWRQSEPVGKLAPTNNGVSYGFWPVSGAWLVRHIWEHYDFTQDEDFLKQQWETLRGAALFMMDWLIEDTKGYLYTSPSTSPENTYKIGNDVHKICKGSTMDLAIAMDVFDIAIKAFEIIKLDKKFIDKVIEVRKKVRPYQIGSKGQLLEWDKEYIEPEPHHRHISLLYGLYPGNSINQETPELKEASKQTMLIRGDDATGWSLGWKTNVWARLGDGEQSMKFINMMLRPINEGDSNYTGGGGVYPNLLDAHPPFQIDGNFGVTAGILEMLIQSHEGEIKLLPALPKEWGSGHIKGIVARGSYVIDMEWKDGMVREKNIRKRNQINNNLNPPARLGRIE